MNLSQKSLGEIAELAGGVVQTGPFGSQLHSSDYRDEGTPVVMPQDIVDDKISEATIARVDEATVNRLARHKLASSDIVIPRRGELGKRALVSDEQAGWLCGTGSLKVSIAGGPVLPQYLFYYLKQPHVVRQIESKAVGSTMLNLSATALSSLVIAYPTLDTQRRIASILAAYDDLIENNRRRMALLEEAMHRLYRHWFVHLRFPGHEQTPIRDGVPEGWCRTTLGQIVEEVRRRVNPSDYESNVPYVGLEHIPRRSIALTDWGSSDNVSSDKHAFEHGEILFGKIRPYFHKVVVAPLAGICSSDTIVMKPKEPNLFGLVLATVSSTAFVDYTSKTSNEGSKMPRANWTMMTAYSILLPPEPLLDEFSSIVARITTQIETLIHMNRRLREARDLLLPRLMNGSIPV